MLQIIDFCEEVYNAGNRSPYLIAFLIDLYIDKATHIKDRQKDDASEPLENIYAIKVSELCNIMAVKHDTIRAKYWKYVAESFENSMAENEK